MKSVLKTKLQAEDGIYKTISWKNFKKRQSLYGETEYDKIALMHDPYVVAWKMKGKEKLIDENVEHLPKELS